MNTRWVRIYDCHDCKEQSKVVSESTIKSDKVLDVTTSYQQRQENDFKCPVCGSQFVRVSAILEAYDAV